MFPGNKAKIKFNVVLTDKTFAALLDYIKAKRTGTNSKVFGALFKNSKYFLQLTNNMLIYFAKKACIENYKQFTPHSIRHSHATYYLEFGGKIESLSFELGHKDIRHTQRYTRKKNTQLLQDHKNIKW